MATDDKTNHPTPNSGDAVHSITKIGLSAIPILGGPAAEIFSQIIIPPLSKRRNEWLESIAKRLKALEEEMNSFSIESLAENEVFITILMHASQVAIRTHCKKKIKALSNIILNSAIESPDEAMQMIMLNFIDTTTSWHLRVLNFYHNPEPYLENQNITLTIGDYLSQYIPRVFNEMKGKEAFCLQIERDLINYGLIYTEGQWYTNRTTETGEQLISLISSPLKKI